MSEEGFLDAQVEFSLRLLKELGVDSTVSTVLSPISIVLALSLAYAGADGETRQEFDDVFAKGQSKDQLHESFRKLGEFLAPSADRQYTLETANKNTYKQVVDQFYNGTFESLDFGKPFDVAQNVNSFVKEKTRDKIQDLISLYIILQADSILNDTKMVLVNAIYYKGDWKTKFDKNNTEEKDFFADENNTAKVKMMKKSFKVAYYEHKDFQLVGLPYANEDIFFYAILPTEKFGLNKLLSELKADQLRELINIRHKTEVVVELPQFKIKTSANLKGQLVKLGFKQGFSNSANFRGISDEELKIDEVIHKAFIEASSICSEATNEEGSEAAAATGLTMRLLSAGPAREEPPHFLADHPFLFVLTGKDSQILFVGTVRNFD
ncbi:putative serpin-like protein [Aphelenchoides bicaudatus]|nr:putative serpin-like protein [Aphelenchoides bicaudatus]